MSTQMCYRLSIVPDVFVVHLCIGLEPKEATDLTAEEQKGLQRYSEFGSLGNAYAREHGTRPATIGLVLSSSPIAQLAW